MNGPVAFRINEGAHSFSRINLTRPWQTLTNTEARGIVWCFEKPLPNATYVLGCDPAMGITGWKREIVMDDEAHDNSAIEVWRIGIHEQEVDVTETDKETGKEVPTGKKRIIRVPTDYQVAEYAAPVDFEDCAAVVNALGRLYRGRGSMGVAHTIIEVYPGNGWMVEKTLISKYGYVNFYQPKLVNTLMPVVAGKGIGWVSNYKTREDLWTLGLRRFNNGGVVLRSPWLLDELKTTKPLAFLSDNSEAKSGKHDDRIRATMLAFWAAHDFSSTVKIETQTTIEKGAKKPNWQASDLSVDRLSDEWNKRFREIGEMP